ncbi:carbohydrate-binding family 9-like protein [Coprobacter sp.]
MKKVLSVPFIPELKDLPLEKACDLLEEKAMRQSVECVNWPEQFPYKPITIFDIARSETSLYIKYFVRGNCLLALNSEDNSPVWQDSCVEFFVQIPGETEYYNFEFNCIGAALAAKRQSREIYTHFSPEKMARIGRYASAGRKPFQEMQGIFAWELLVTIPFDLIGVDPKSLPEKLYANFFKCADNSSLPHYLSWSPIKTENPDFHRPEFFGEICF